MILGKSKEENELSDEYDTEELLEFQGTLVDLVIFENSLWWQRQGVFLVFNSIFAAVLWSLFPSAIIFQTTPLSWNFFATILSVTIIIFCLFVSLFWLATIQTANKWRNFYVSLAKNLEKRMEKYPDYKIWSGKQIEDTNLEFLKVRGSSWGRLIPISFIVFWLIICVFFIGLIGIYLITP